MRELCRHWYEHLHATRCPSQLRCHLHPLSHAHIRFHTAACKWTRRVVQHPDLQKSRSAEVHRACCQNGGQITILARLASKFLMIMCCSNVCLQTHCSVCSALGLKHLTFVCSNGISDAMAFPMPPLQLSCVSPSVMCLAQKAEYVHQCRCASSAEDCGGRGTLKTWKASNCMLREESFSRSIICRRL